jgi:polyphosphate kinase 2
MGHKNKEKLEDSSYSSELRQLQIELVKLQNSLIKNGDQILVILEGRDTAGKDGTIKAITEHLSPRETRIVALGKPSDSESAEWYFQRYVAQLPKQGEFVLFNRSWYNRAGVERVMNFCTKAQYVNFIETVNDFESILASSGITILKYYLDISKKEQALRLKARENDPLKQWKISPIDQQAQKNWNAYSKCRNEMLEKTSPKDAPWTIVKANDKKLTHLNLIRDLLSRVSYPGKDKSLLKTDKEIAFKWDGDLSKLEK